MHVTLTIESVHRHGIPAFRATAIEHDRRAIAVASTPLEATQLALAALCGAVAAEIHKRDPSMVLTEDYVVTFGDGEGRDFVRVGPLD